MIKFTLYTSDYVGKLSNCLYPHKAIITDKESLIRAVSYDHVSAKYKDNYRSSTNFISADNVPMDCDNDHSDNPKDWVTPKDVASAFSDVPFVVVHSRNHMKQKGEKAARPRFHVYFMTPTVTDVQEYSELKQRIAIEFPYFDSNALDGARLIFGTQNPVVEIYDGHKSVMELLNDTSFEEWDDEQEQVPEGRRNSTMSRYAGRLIKRFGSTSEAHAKFLKLSEKCNPPLDDAELKKIWNSAVSFGKRLAAQEGYIPPEQYNTDLQFKPDDFSDTGQAEILVREYSDRLRYSPSTDFIVYNGSFWEESKPKAQGVAQELTARQLKEAKTEIEKQKAIMKKNGALKILESLGPKRAVNEFNKEQFRSFTAYEAARAYKKYAIKRRDSNGISTSLKEARPNLLIEQKMLDLNEFLLNTPSAIYDLRKGINGTLEQEPKYLITKQTAVEPSDDGADKWQDALNTFFCNDKELTEYVQKMVGL